MSPNSLAKVVRNQFRLMRINRSKGLAGVHSGGVDGNLIQGY